MCLQKSAIWFSENEGEGGWNAVWNFSKNASVLVNGGFLNDGGYGVDGGGDDVNDENNSEDGDDDKPSISTAQIEIQCKRRNAPFSYRHAASR